MSETIALLDRLIGFDTVSSRSNLDLIDFAEAFLNKHAFRVTRLADPAEPKAGLYAEIGPTGAGVLLSAHSDVVPVDGQDWTRDPFRLTREGSRLYGRGTTDMKGFLAAILAVAGKASAVELKEPLKLVISYDEEVGCIGIERMLDRLAPLLGNPRVAIVGEPTEMHVAIGHKGKQAFQATVTGQAGHSALAPRFVNALNVSADFVQRLGALQQELCKNGARDAQYDIPFSTVHVGKLSGGTALNIVPDRAEITFETRVLASDSAKELYARIEAAADKACASFGRGARIDVQTLFSYPGLDVAANSEVVSLVTAWADSPTTKVAFGTEAGFLDKLGIPTVVCGPGSMQGQGHKADEYIEESQLAACDAMLTRVLKQLQHA